MDYPDIRDHLAPAARFRYEFKTFGTAIEDVRAKNYDLVKALCALLKLKLLIAVKIIIKSNE